MLFCRKMRICQECGVAFERDKAIVRPELCKPHRRPYEDRAQLEGELFEWVRENLTRFAELHKHSQIQQYRASSANKYWQTCGPLKIGVWMTPKDFEPEPRSY